MQKLYDSPENYANGKMSFSKGFNTVMIPDTYNIYKITNIKNI